MRTLLLAFMAVLGLWACGNDTGGPGGVVGWEKAGAYDALYKPAELDRIKGEYVSGFDVTPMAGMAPGLGIVVRDRADDRPVKVHLGPKAYLAEELKAFGLKPGMKLKITGSWASVGGEDVLLAAKVKKGEFEQIKVRRTKDGLAFWNMSAEERAAEKAREFEDDEAK